MAKICQPMLRAPLFELENVCLVMVDVTKKLVPRWANFVLPPSPHCCQADSSLGCDLLLSHVGVVRSSPRRMSL
jgi:hypothetical protein